MRMRAGDTRGYVGLLVLLIGTAILVFLYMNYSPLKLTSGGATSTSEADQAIQEAQAVKKAIETQDAKMLQGLP